MKLKLKAIFIAACMLPALYGSVALAAEAGTALKNDTLRKEPFADAKTAAASAVAKLWKY